MDVLIYLGQNANINNYDLKDKYVIGVERGAYILALNKISFDLALGDFDSISEIEVKEVEKYAKNILRLNPIKDDTDTAVALTKAYEISSKVSIIGGIEGKRVEHLFANLSLIYKYKSLKIIDDSSLMFSLDKDYTFKDYNEYKFISFYALEDSIISLNNFKYNISNYNLKLYDPLCVSNEFNSLSKIDIKKGRVLVILSKNDCENRQITEK